MQANSYRHEMKYTISFLDYLVYKHRLDYVMKRDTNCTEGPYTITSLYYDDLNDKAYHEKMQGEAFRHKYRLRYYGQKSTRVKLERKSKLHQMTKKESVALSAEDVQDALACKGLMSDDNDALKEAFSRQLRSGILKPKVLVRYERIAYVHKLGDVRITFDTHVRASRTPGSDLEAVDGFQAVIAPDEVIMEIKFNGIIPDYILSLLQSGHTLQTSSSKYVYSRSQQLI